MDKEKFDRLKEIDRILSQPGELDEQRRQYFEEFLEAFPGSHEHWIAYIKEELNTGNIEGVERLFYRCLPNVPNVSLFQFYINFVRGKESSPETIKKAYDYALDKVGLDIKAYPIYKDYLDFLEDSRGKLVGADLEIPREVYHRSLVVPLENGQLLHQNYHLFETDRAPQVCNSLFKEWDQHFKTTKSTYQGKATRVQPLTCDLFAQGSAALEQLFYWRFFIKNETTNELNAKPERYHQFVIYAYKKALVPLRYQWIMWHDFAQFYLSYGNDAAAIETYAEGVRILPRNLMLSFAYAELLESRKRSQDALPVYRNIIENAVTQNDKTLAQIQLLKFLQRTEGPDAMRREFVIAFEKNVFTYHLLIAAAEIENAVNLNSESAKRILAKGMILYGQDPAFIEELVNQFIKLNYNEGLMEVYNKVVTLRVDRRLEVSKKILNYFRLTFDKTTCLISNLKIILQKIADCIAIFKSGADLQVDKSVVAEFQKCLVDLTKCDVNIKLITKFVDEMSINESGTTREPINKDIHSSLEKNIDFIEKGILSNENQDFVRKNLKKSVDFIEKDIAPFDSYITPIDKILIKIHKMIITIEKDILDLDSSETREKLKLRSFFLPDDYK